MCFYFLFSRRGQKFRVLGGAVPPQYDPPATRLHSVDMSCRDTIHNVPPAASPPPRVVVPCVIRNGACARGKGSGWRQLKLIFGEKTAPGYALVLVIVPSCLQNPSSSTHHPTFLDPPNGPCGSARNRGVAAQGSAYRACRSEWNFSKCTTSAARTAVSSSSSSLRMELPVVPEGEVPVQLSLRSHGGR